MSCSLIVGIYSFLSLSFLFPLSPILWFGKEACPYGKDMGMGVWAICVTKELHAAVGWQSSSRSKQNNQSTSLSQAMNRVYLHKVMRCSRSWIALLTLWGWLFIVPMDQGSEGCPMDVIPGFMVRGCILSPTLWILCIVWLVDNKLDPR